VHVNAIGRCVRESITWPGSSVRQRGHPQPSRRYHPPPRPCHLANTTAGAGLVGELTAVKPGAFAVAVNARYADGASLPALLASRAWNAVRGGWSVTALVRHACETCATYDECVALLSTAPLVADAYLSIAGTQPGQACVVSRAGGVARVARAPDAGFAASGCEVRRLGAAGHALVQTNSDIAEHAAAAALAGGALDVAHDDAMDSWARAAVAYDKLADPRAGTPAAVAQLLTRSLVGGSGVRVNITVQAALLSPTGVDGCHTTAVVPTRTMGPRITLPALSNLRVRAADASPDA
jgi:hypothetical protein